MCKLLIIIMAIGLVIYPNYSEARGSIDYLGEISVTVEGATRSKRPFIESLVRNCLKRGEYQTWQSVNSTAMGQCLSNTRLFSSAEVEVREPEIIVRLTDRWTLIPIPNFYASDGKETAGVFVYDSNFLGYGKILGLGGAYSTEGNTFSLMFMDRAVKFTDYTYSMFVVRANDDIEAYNGETVVYGYRQEEESLTIAPGYRFTPNLDLSLSISYQDRQFRQLDLYTPFPEDSRSWSIGAGINYRRADYKLFYNDGLAARIRWSGQLERSDNLEKVSSLTASLAWDKLLFDRHALQLGLRGEYQANAGDGDVSRFGRGKGYRGIEPNGLWSDRIAAVSADYQIPVRKWQHGTITVAPFVDYGIYRSFFSDSEEDYLAYGIGAYYFMNVINLPGLGLTIGTNDDFMGEYIAIQLGMGFH